MVRRSHLISTTSGLIEKVCTCIALKAREIHHCSASAESAGKRHVTIHCGCATDLMNEINEIKRLIEPFHQGLNFFVQDNRFYQKLTENSKNTP